MHPIERLRSMARAGDVRTAPLIREAALALRSVAHDEMELVTACRQLIDHRPASGPLVWLASRMITGADPNDEAWDAVEAIERDTTARELALLVPAEATVVVVGSPELTSSALMERPDIEVLVVDTTGDGYGLVHRLTVADSTAVDVPAAGVGSAAVEADLVVLEVEALGPEAGLAPMGSLAAAAVAQRASTPVWLVAGVGRCLPARMWDGVQSRAIAADPWDATHELVGLDLVDAVIGPGGSIPIAEARLRIDCPVAPELF